MSTAPTPLRELDERTGGELRRAAAEIRAEFGTSATSARLLYRVAEVSGRFDHALRLQCRPVDTADGFFLLRGIAAEDGDVYDISLLLLASVMGIPLAQGGRPDGRLVDVVTSPSHWTTGAGATGTVLVAPHAEDVGSSERAHLLMLGCTRVPGGAAGTTATAAAGTWGTPRHVGDSPTGVWGQAGQPPTLFATDDDMTLRFAPSSVPPRNIVETYSTAFRQLADEQDVSTVEVCLNPGEVLVVDHDLAVHAWVPLRVRCDGADLRLKRAQVRVPGRDTPPASRAAGQDHGPGALEAHAS
ncbi:oxygenase [Streptomyces sp. NPDC059917]|uniref:oxygenase n=1 Tax=Streptomyces sp. NPDC059917 TaxID=3347002 RepID=UPI00364E3535